MLVAYVVVAAVVAAHVYIAARAEPIFWPLLALVVIFSVFLAVIAAKQKAQMRFLQIGIVYAGFLLLYAAVPLLMFAVSDFVHTPAGDYRLWPATIEQRATLAWWYVAALASFCTAYAMVPMRGRAHGTLSMTRPDVPLVFVLFVATLCAALVRLAVGQTLDTGGTYVGGYLAIQQLPLLAAQLFSQLLGSELTFQILLVTALFSHYRRARSFLFLFFVGLIVLNIVRPGARTPMLLVFVSAAVMYDFFVRRLSMRFIAIAAAGGFVLFTSIAFFRQDTGKGPVSLKQAFVTMNEFEAMYGNAYELKYTLGQSGHALRTPALYFADLTALFPQQIFPFQKTAPSLWYISTFYRDLLASGGGLAFGALSEAVIGAGVIELIWRGALLGLIFGLMHRRLLSRRVSFAFLGFYVWLTVWAFQSIRNTSFGLLNLALYRFLVPLCAVYLVAMLLRRNRAAPALRRMVRVAEPPQ
jgi:hypothetical protein